MQKQYSIAAIYEIPIIWIVQCSGFALTLDVITLLCALELCHHRHYNAVSQKSGWDRNLWPHFDACIVIEIITTVKQVLSIFPMLSNNL